MYFIAPKIPALMIARMTKQLIILLFLFFMSQAGKVEFAYLDKDNEKLNYFDHAWIYSRYQQEAIICREDDT